MSDLIRNQPSASVLINSMRSMGYSFESAVSDLIDNSITAQSKNIYIDFYLNDGRQIFTILDDGIGMDEPTLLEAMKYGSKSNLEIENQLGRFGLGLKTASLSQCRKLTVLTKQNNKIVSYSWDLDLVISKDEWLMIKNNPEIFKDMIFFNDFNSLRTGTCIILENFDNIDRTLFIQDITSELVESLSKHISLVFHRFLKGKNKIQILLNGNKIIPIDPFLEDHPKTNPREETKMEIEDSNGVSRIVSVQPYVLPFFKDMSKKDFDTVGGDENFNNDHGFYIYRNKRLIIHGKWFGMRNIDWLSKNLRIKVDIPITLDSIWAIDIKKQNAVLPSIFKRRLVKTIEQSSLIVKATNEFKGRRVNNTDGEYVWDRLLTNGGAFKYAINKNSTYLKTIIKEKDNIPIEQVYKILEIVENSLPFQSIYNDYSQRKVDESKTETTSSVEQLAKELIKEQLIKNKDINKFLIDLFNMEPFSFLDEESKIRLRNVKLWHKLSPESLMLLKQC